MDRYCELKLENQLCFQLYVVSKEIIKKYKTFLDEVNLTYTQYITMLVLWEFSELNVKQIGKKLFLDSGTLTPVLKQLESKGYILRKRDIGDERNLIVSITEDGLSMKDKVMDIPKKISCQFSLTSEEAENLYRLLYKILREIDG